MSRLMSGQTLCYSRRTFYFKRPTDLLRKVSLPSALRPLCESDLGSGGGELSEDGQELFGHGTFSLARIGVFSFLLQSLASNSLCKGSRNHLTFEV